MPLLSEDMAKHGSPTRTTEGPVVMADIRHGRPPAERLFVTGADTVLGANLAVSLADRFTVLGLFTRHPVSLPGCDSAPCGSADRARLESLIRRDAPDWIIHCGALASGAWDLPNLSPDGEDEARTCRMLAEVSGERGCRLTVISTDAVFCGPRMFHGEEAPATSPRPLARAARAAECVLESSGAMVVRTHAYGWSPANTPPALAERIWQALTEGVLSGFEVDHHATPILAADLAEFLYRAYRRGLKGLYHVTGAERTSVHRFATEMAAAFGLDSTPVAPQETPPGEGDAGPPQETSLNTRQARRDLECPMPMIREGLDRFAEQAASGYRARLKSYLPPTAIRGDAA